MKLTKPQRHSLSTQGTKLKNAGVPQSEASTKAKYGRNESGNLVRLKRVRRKKDTKSVAEVAIPNQVYGTDRVLSTSEMGKAAPIQTKPNAVGAKKGRYRSITPGLNGLVKKANPAPVFRNPFTSFETVL